MPSWRSCGSISLAWCAGRTLAAVASQMERVLPPLGTTQFLLVLPCEALHLTQWPTTAPLPSLWLVLCAAGSYDEVNGTSAATALVGGAAGLILSATANDAVDDMGWVRDALLEGADLVASLTQMRRPGVRGGSIELVARGRRLNTYNALASYIGDSSWWPWLPPALCGVAPDATTTIFPTLMPPPVSLHCCWSPSFPATASFSPSWLHVAALRLHMQAGQALA